MAKKKFSKAEEEEHKRSEFVYYAVMSLLHSYDRKIAPLMASNVIRATLSWMLACKVRPQRLKEVLDQEMLIAEATYEEHIKRASK